MRYYETLYLINPTLSDEDCGKVVVKFNNIIEKNKGVVVKVEEWGKKILAYEVKKYDKGYYVLLRYCGGPGITEEIKRAFSLDSKVIKYQTIKLSDNADPEALKVKANEGKDKAVEEVHTKEEVDTE